MWKCRIVYRENGGTHDILKTGAKILTYYS